MSAFNYFSVPMGNGEKKGLKWTAVQNLIHHLRLPHPDSDLAVQIRKEIPMTKHLYERFYERPWLYYQIIQSYALYTAGNHSVCSFGVNYKKIPFEVRMRMDPKDAWPKMQPPTAQQWFDKERASALRAIIDLNKENDLRREELQMDDQLYALFELATRDYRNQLDKVGSWIGEAREKLARYCSKINHKNQERQNIIALLLRHNRRIIETHAVSPMAALIEYHGNNKTFAVRLAEVFRQYVKRMEEIENELSFVLASDEMGDKKQLRTQLALSMRQVIQLRRANFGIEENRYNLGLENQQLRSRIKDLEAKVNNIARWQKWTNEEAKKAQAEFQESMEADHGRKVLELKHVNLQLTTMSHEVERENSLLRIEGGTKEEVNTLKVKLEAYRRDNDALKKQRDEAKADGDIQAKKNEIARRQNVNLEKSAEIHKKDIEKLQKQNADLMRALQKGQTMEAMRYGIQARSDKLQRVILRPHNEASNDQAGSGDSLETQNTPSSASSHSSASTEKTFYYDDRIDRIVERAVVTANLPLSELKADEIESLGYKFNVLRYWKKTHEDDNKKLRICYENELLAKQEKIDSLLVHIRELETPSTPSSISSDKTFYLDDFINKIEEEDRTTAKVSLSKLKFFEIETFGKKYNELRAWKKAHKDGNNKLRKWYEEELVAKQVEIDTLTANVHELEGRPSFPNEQIKKLAAVEAVSNENAILRLRLADEKTQRLAAEESLDALAESLEGQLQAKDNFYGAPGCFHAYRVLKEKYNDLAASLIELWDDNDALRLVLREMDPDTGLANVALSKLRQLHRLRPSKLSDEEVGIVKDLHDTLVSLADGLRSKLRNLDLGSRMPGGPELKLQKNYDLTFKLPNGLSKQGWLLHRVHIELLMSKIGTLEATIDDLGRVVQGKETIIGMLSDRWKVLGVEDGGQRWQEFEEISHRLANTEDVVRRLKAMLAQQTEALAEAEAAVWVTQDLQARIDELEEEVASQHLSVEDTDDGRDGPLRGRSPTPTPCINGLWGGFGGNAFKLQKTVRCLENEFADVYSRFYEVTAENSTLKSDIGQREWWIGQLRKKSAQRKMHISDLRDADFEKEAQKLRMRIGEMESRKDEMEDEHHSKYLNDGGDLMELKHTVSRQNSELTQAYLRLNDANATASRLRGIIELRDAFIRGAEIEHEEELKELRETISGQRKDLAQAYSIADGLKTIISDLRGTVDQRAVNNNELKATNSGLRQAVADLKDEIQELNIRIQSLKKEGKEMEDHFLNAQSAQDILDVENYRIQKLKEELTQLHKEKEEVEKENKEVIELCNGRTRELNVTMDKYNKARIMLHCTTKEVTMLKTKLVAAKKEAMDGHGQSFISRDEHRPTSMPNAARGGSAFMLGSPHTPSMRPSASAQRDGSPEPRSGGLTDRRNSMSCIIAHFTPRPSPGHRMFQPSFHRASSPPARSSIREKKSYAQSAAFSSSLGRHAGQVLRSQLDTACSSHVPLSECSPSEAEKRLKAMHGTELMEAASLVEEHPVLSSPPRQVQRDHTAEVARIKALMALNPVVKASEKKEPRIQAQPAARTSALFAERELVEAVEGIWERPLFVQGIDYVPSEASIATCTPLLSPELPKEEVDAPMPISPSTMDMDSANAGKMKKTASSLSLLSSNRLSKRLSRGFLKATATASTTIENIAGFVGNAITKSKSKSELKDSSGEDGAHFKVPKKSISQRGIEIAREPPVKVSAAIASRAASGDLCFSAEKTPEVVKSGIRKSFTGQKESRWSEDEPAGLYEQPSSDNLRSVTNGLPVPTALDGTPSPAVEMPRVAENGTAKETIDKDAEILKEAAPTLNQNVGSGLLLRATSGEASPANVKTVVFVIGDDHKSRQISVSSLPATGSPTAPATNTIGLHKVGTVRDSMVGQTSALSLAEAAASPEARAGFRKLCTVGDPRVRQRSALSSTEPSKLRVHPSLSNIRENPFMKADPKKAPPSGFDSPIITGGERPMGDEESKRVVSGGLVKNRAATFSGAIRENGLELKSPLIDSHRAVSETTGVVKLDSDPGVTDKLRAIHAPKPFLPSTPHTLKSPVECPNSQNLEFNVKKLRLKTSASRLPLAISGNRSISAALKSAPLKPSPLANSFGFPSDTSLASLSEKQSSKTCQSKQSGSGASLDVGPLTLEGNPVRQKLSAGCKNKTLGDTSNGATTTLIQTRVVPRKPSRLPLKSSSDSRTNRTETSREFTVRKSSNTIARPATPPQVTPTVAATPSALRPTSQGESSMPMQSQPGTKQRSSPSIETRSSVPAQEEKTDRSKDQEALFGQTFAPTSDAVAPSHRSSVYSEVMPSSPPIMALYDAYEASSDYEGEVDDNPVAPNHHPTIPPNHNIVALSGFRPNQALGNTNLSGTSAISLGASSRSPAVPAQPLSSDGIAPRHPVITPSGLRRPISIGAAATLYSAAASSSPRPPALPGRDLDSLPSQRNRSAPPPVELARRPAIADRSTSQRGGPLPPKPPGEHTPKENLTSMKRIEDPFITKGNRDRAQKYETKPVDNQFRHQRNKSQHSSGHSAVNDEHDLYISHSARSLPPPQEYRQFEGNPFTSRGVNIKDKGRYKSKALAENENEYLVFPSSPPSAQYQLEQLANQFTHCEFSGLPQNGQNPFTDDRNSVKGPVVNGVQYPPWDDVKGPLNDNPFTDSSHLALLRLAPTVASPEPPRRHTSNRERSQYSLPIISRPLNADPFADCSRLAPAIAPPFCELSSSELQQYILPRTRQGLQNQRYEPPHMVAPGRPANDNLASHPYRAKSDGDLLFDFLLEDVRKPSSSLPAPVAPKPVPRHPTQELSSSRRVEKQQTPLPRPKIVQQQQPSSQDRFGQGFGDRFEQFDRTFNDDNIPNNMPNCDKAKTWAVLDLDAAVEELDTRRLKQQHQQSVEQRERGWKKMFSRNDRAALNPALAPTANGSPSGDSSGDTSEQRRGGSRLASFGQGLRDLGRSTSNVFRRSRRDHITPSTPPNRQPNHWGRQLLADLNASARRLFGRGAPPLSRPLAETRNPPSHGLTGGEHGMRGRRSSARSLHTRGSRVFSPVDFGSSPPCWDSRLDSDPPCRHPLAEGLSSNGTAEWNLRRRNSRLGREEHESDWVDESGVGYDEDEISIEYNFGDRAWALKEGKKRGRRFSQ